MSRTASILAGLALVFALAPGAFPAAASEQAERALEEARRVASIVDQVKARYRGVEAFEQRFVQRATSQVFGPDQENTGVIRARKPDRLRFDYEVPAGQTGVFDGTTWWLLDPEQRHVSIHDGTRDDLVVALLTGRLELAEAFSIRASEGGGELVTLELVPREARDEVERVEIDIDSEKGDLRRVEIEDPLQNRMTYSFGPLVEVEPLPMAHFSIAIPEGYTVDRE